MSKKTMLDDQAEIYQPRKAQTEKEKLKDMPFSKKAGYLWEYYKFHAAVVLIGISLLGYILYTALTPRIVPQLYAAFINNNIYEEALLEYQEGLTEYMQLNPERERVEFNTNFYLNDESQFEMNMRQVLVTYITAKEVDVIIAPESEFKEFAYYGYFDKLSEQLPTDLYSNLTDYFYISDSEEDPEKNAFGIYLDNTDLFENKIIDTEPYILGIVVNSNHKFNAIEFIRYLFEEK